MEQQSSSANAGQVRPAVEQVLHYQLLKRLGAGGMGVVFAAHDTRLQRPVALKFLPSALARDDVARERLFTEARAAAALDHPHVGVVHALEEAEDGQLFIVMKHYAGKTLEQRLIPAPVDEALRIGWQVALGLAHAHEAGVVHCDVKPANVLLTSDGLVKILDFGLATLKGPAAINAVARGTMEYMSPEQVRGRPIGPQTDVWSLGVMLYELLTGVSPFRTDRGGAATIQRIVGEEPDRPTRLEPALPAAVDTVLERALAKEPQQRYASADELAADLERLLSARFPPSAESTVSTEAASRGAMSGLRPEATTRPPTPPNNLPPLGAIVGRREERSLIASYLEDEGCRVLTLIGLGGIGKSRLGVQAAHDALHSGSFEGGVYLVPLGHCARADFALDAIAEALGRTLGAASDRLTALAKLLGDARTLLVLDDLDRLLPEAGVLSELIAACPNLRLLTTSRERLDLREEWTLPLGGLPYPESDATGVEQALEYGAVSFFVSRAKRLDPDFSLTPEALPHVLRICRQVGGMPLALELAAPWIRALPSEALADAIARDLDLLSAGSRDLPSRQQSVRVLLQHSWERVTEEARRLLTRLAVFEGGFTLEAAATLTGASPATLASLADASLVSLTPSGRYTQHPLVLQYGRERLAETPELHHDLRRAHARYYLELLRQQGTELRGPDQNRALERIDSERHNIATAWRAATADGDVALLSAAAGSLRLFHDRRGRIKEGEELLKQTLGALPQAAAVALNLAWLALLQGRLDEAEAHARAGLDAFTADASYTHASYTDRLTGLNTLGAVSAGRGRLAQAEEWFRAGLALAEEAGDEALTASCLDNLASTLERLGRYEEAADLYRRGLALAERQENHGQQAVILNNLGALLLHSDQPHEALRLLERGAALARELGMARVVPFFLVNQGDGAYRLGRFEEAKALFEEALAGAREQGNGRLEAGLLAELGRVATARHQTREAADLLRGGLRSAWKLADAPLTLHVLVYLAELQVAVGRPELAAEWLDVVARHPATEQKDRHLALRLLSEAGPATTSGSGPRHGTQADALELLVSEALGLVG